MRALFSKNPLLWFPIFLALYELVVYISNDMFLPAMLSLQAYFDCSQQAAQNMVGWWMVGACSLTLLLGPISDRYGRKPVMLSSSFVFLLGSAICCCSSNLSLFYLGRFFQGCSSCGLIAAGYSTIQVLYSGTQAIKIVSRMAAVAMLAPSLGPVAGSLILQCAHWQWIFILTFILGFVCLLGITYSMPETIEKPTQQLQLKTIFKGYYDIITSSMFISGNLSNAFSWGGLMCWITCSPIIIMHEFGISEKYFGYLQVPVFGSYVLGAFLTDRLTNHIHVFKILRIGALTCILPTAVLIAKSWITPITFPELLVAMSVFCVGIGLTGPAMWRVTCASIGHSMSYKTALFNFNGALVASCFTFGIGYIYRGNSNILAYLFFLCALGVAGFQNLFIYKYRKLYPKGTEAPGLLTHTVMH